jgi:hypothetical protein
MNEFQQMVGLTAKLFYYLDTFEINSGRETARQILLDELRKDAVEQKMLELRRKNNARIYREQLGDADPYETAAAAFYRKYGTRGEF